MFEMKMPKAGQSMEDGTVVKWHKAEGQAVKGGDVLLDVETDNATVEVESVHSGTLAKIVCHEGQTVPVHAVIALIAAKGEDISSMKDEVMVPKMQGAQRRFDRLTAPSEAEGQADANVHVAEQQAGNVHADVTPPAGVVPVLMPKAGQSMEEGEIVAWRVKPGDRINTGDIIFDVETDKATIEVEATDGGRLSRIVVKEGESCIVLQPVAYLSEDDAAVDKYIASTSSAAGAALVSTEQSSTAKTQATPSVQSSAGPSVAALTATGRVKASPAARKIAAERGIDISALGAGSGPGGRIISTDVPAEAGRASASPVRPAAGPGGQVRRRQSGMRRAIAKNLLASKQTIPHFYMRLTIDADALMAFYRAEKAKYPCSVNDVVAAACARAVAEFPAFRSRLDREEVVEFDHANVGIAVGMDDGLVVPVLVAAETMNLRQLAAETRRLVEAARKGKIEGMGQGVVTITNLGMFGVEEFSAIINPPEAAILAVGAVREDVVVSGGAMRPGKVMTMTLSADHRIIDGLLAAKFLARLKEILLAPAQLG